MHYQISIHNLLFFQKWFVSQKRVFEKENANSRKSVSSQNLIWRKKLEIPDNSPPLIRNDAGSNALPNINSFFFQKWLVSQKRIFEKENANSRKSVSSQNLIWRKKLEIPDNSPPLIRNDAGSCDFWNITGGMDQDIFHNIDTDRYSEKLKTM